MSTEQHLGRHIDLDVLPAPQDAEGQPRAGCIDPRRQHGADRVSIGGVGEVADTRVAFHAARELAVEAKCPQELDGPRDVSCDLGTRCRAGFRPLGPRRFEAHQSTEDREWSACEEQELPDLAAQDRLAEERDRRQACPRQGNRRFGPQDGDDGAGQAFGDERVEKVHQIDVPRTRSS